MINNKGFTLIELLAVITILGILMIIGIPAVQRTINNSRRDTFLDTAKKYANAVKTAWVADEFSCMGGVRASNAPAEKNYLVWFSSGTIEGLSVPTPAKSNKERLLQSGGNSSWGNIPVGGFVRIYVPVDDTGKVLNPKFYVYMIDGKGHGVVIDDDNIESDDLERSNVVLSGATLPDYSTGVMCNVDA